MRHEVRITGGAESDLAEIVAFLAGREGPDMAGQMLERMLAIAESLSQTPEQGSHPRELLSLGIRDFRQVICQPYRLIYRITGKQVFLLLVADGRRDFQSLLERRILKA
ncbi:type II toxin-antitoxin system RelE/ParE family toxin [Holophaga foetida]|uniref:type II toxin-antitoxin system RelE/ParE family toxin n=1 Tax=Holophaga foetida TaxID=35839 RepID=UPI0002474CC9|nr:type II toxin-antitoxin system RelE/ParE family toxin [Holophaga foetida]